MTLVEFLLARITEDEAEIGAPFGRDEKAGPNGLGWAEVGAISDVLMCGHARALAECQAKRRIVEDCAEYEGPETDGLNWRTLHALAAVYADHPDYLEEWRP